MGEGGEEKTGQGGVAMPEIGENPGAAEGGAPPVIDTADIAMQPGSTVLPGPARQNTAAKVKKPKLQEDGDLLISGLARLTTTDGKIQPLTELARQLRVRGWSILLFVPDKADNGKTFIMTIRMTARLLQRTAIALGLENKRENDYPMEERVYCIMNRLPILKKVLAGFKYTDVMLLHDTAAMDRVLQDASPDALFTYFGSEVALYFGWLKFYTKYLAIPGVFGVFLSLYQLYTNKLDSIYIPIFNIALSVWVTLLLEGWKRANSTYIYNWGLMNREDSQEAHHSVKDSETAEDEGKQMSAIYMFFVSLPINIFFIICLVHMMLYFVWLSDNAIAIYGEKDYRQYIPTLLYSIVPPAAQAIYGYLVVYLNDLEGHATRELAKQALQFKLFAFHFVNSYCSLFYIAFWLQDIERLRAMLLSLLLTKQIVGNFTEILVPVISDWIMEIHTLQGEVQAAGGHRHSLSKEGKMADVEGFARRCFEWLYLRYVYRKPKITEEDLARVVNGGEEGTDGWVENKELEDKMNLQRKSADYDVASEHIEIVLQYGYVCMFAVSFPLAPVLAMLNNVWESKLDMTKLKMCKRLMPVMAKDIGGWYMALEVTGVIAVLTNCLLMVLLSDKYDFLLPANMQPLTETAWGKFLIALILEHILIAIKVLLAGVIEDVPLWIQEELKRGNKAPRRRISAATAPLNVQTSIMNAETAIREARAASIPFSPLMFLPIMTLPYIVLYFHLSPVWVLPVSFLWLAYLHNQKLRSERHLAMHIASDPQLVKMVTSYLPCWYFDSDIERAVWLSSIVQKIWLTVSGMTENIVMMYVQPLLDYYKPTIVDTLLIHKCFLGTIAPVVTGVRFVETTENLVRLDLHISWAGNPEIIVKVGYKGAPLVLCLSEIQFRGKVRVELNPLTCQIPGFGAITCTLLEEPFVDFSFKIANVDVMSIGAAEFGVAKLVTNIIQEILKGFMLYPKQLVIPMLDEIDLEKLANPMPVGRLEIRVVSASNLMVGDIVSSDPYVVMRIGLEKQKTTVKSKSLSPEWNESFAFFVYDLNQPLAMKIMDKDMMSADTPLGDYDFKLTELEPLEIKEYDVELRNAKTGKLKVQLCFTPLKKEGEDSDLESEDESLAAPGLDDDEDFLYDSADESTCAGSVRESRASTDLSLSASRRRSLDDSKDGQPVKTPAVGAVREGILQISAIQVEDYTKKASFANPHHLKLKFAVGNTSFSTSSMKPALKIAFLEKFDFTLTDKTAANSLDVHMIESFRLGSERIPGKLYLDLRTLTKVSHKAVEQVWPVEYKGRVYKIRMKVMFNPFATKTTARASSTASTGTA